MRSLDVVDAVPGLSYRQLDYWLSTGLIHADEDRPGSGFMRDIPEHEVAVLELMVPLVRDGLTPSRAVLIARALAAGETPTLGGLTLTSPPAAQEIPA